MPARGGEDRVDDDRASARSDRHVVHPGVRPARKGLVDDVRLSGSEGEAPLHRDACSIRSKERAVTVLREVHPGIRLARVALIECEIDRVAAVGSDLDVGAPGSPDEGPRPRPALAGTLCGKGGIPVGRSPEQVDPIALLTQANGIRIGPALVRRAEHVRMHNPLAAPGGDVPWTSGDAVAHRTVVVMGVERGQPAAREHEEDGIVVVVGSMVSPEDRSHPLGLGVGADHHVAAGSEPPDVRTSLVVDGTRVGEPRPRARPQGPGGGVEAAPRRLAG